MSAPDLFRARENEATSPANPERPTGTQPPISDDPLQLLRTAIERLNSADRDLPDQAQVAALLAEATKALEHANVISGAMKECDSFLAEDQFDRALEALNAALVIYPADAALAARRREVEERKSAFHTATAVRAALEESEWYLEQGRPDLAVQCLREKTQDLSDHPALTCRLREVESVLQQWDRKRREQTALSRAAALEELTQWQAALTVLEEALAEVPDCPDLSDAAKRVRARWVEDERSRKLERRLEAIRQKIAAGSWTTAIALVENSQAEFPDCADLNLLRSEAAAGRERSELEAMIAELQQSLADGELEQAEKLVSKGFARFGPEPRLGAIREKIEAEYHYREGLRNAQVLFGRHQLHEAECALTELASPDRPEAEALLDAVRKARAASEEEDFCERGRVKALDLMQQQQFAPAADLLRNLLLLFPGNPLLERDLMAAQSGLDQQVPQTGTAVSAPAPEETPAVVTEVLPAFAAAAPTPVGASSRMRRAAIASAASLALVSAAGAAWELSRGGTRSPQPMTARGVTEPRVPDKSSQYQDPEPRPAAQTPPTIAGSRPKPRPAPLRPFVPSGARPTEGSNQRTVIPQPPRMEPIVTAEVTPGLPMSVAKPLDAPMLPPDPPVHNAGSRKPAPATGGRLVGAQPIYRPMPDYPVLARVRGIAGAVRLEATIDERGTVANVRVLSGDPILAAAAKKAVLRWRYKPATLNGQWIATDATIQVLFGDRSE